MTMAVIIGISLCISDGSQRRDGLMVVAGGVTIGTLLGVAFLIVARILGNAIQSLPPVKRLTDLGLRNVWDSKRPVPFQSEVVKMLKAGGSLDLLCHDGLEVLTALSHPAHDALAAPHPALRQACIRFLVLPPRSGRQDPDFAYRSTAEVGLLKLGLSPEEHWRRLATLLDTRRRWEEEFGVRIEVRFLENRPSFRMVSCGNRVWFQPWEQSTCWLDVHEEDQSRLLFGAMRSHFADAWGSSAAELQVNLAQGPTKSTFIRKGVEVGPRTESRLTVSEDAEYSL